MQSAICRPVNAQKNVVILLADAFERFEARIVGIDQVLFEPCSRAYSEGVRIFSISMQVCVGKSDLCPKLDGL